MAMFAMLEFHRYPLADNENKAEYFSLVLMAVVE